MNEEHIDFTRLLKKAAFVDAPGYVARLGGASLEKLHISVIRM